MIAAGLCLMGGCFAQDSSTAVVDTYWPTDWVDMPVYSSSVGVYQHEGILGDINIEDCYMETVQYYESGLGSFFYIMHNSSSISDVNMFIHTTANENGVYFLRIQDNSKAKDLRGTAPSQLRLFMQDGIANGTDGNTVISFTPNMTADFSKDSVRIRVVDARNGIKRYRYSYGFFGIKWFVHAMRSITSSSAIFDFEQKVLVEL